MSVIHNDHCEITVAQHCNLSCRACSHLSPLLSKDFVQPETLRSDLTTMAKYYHTRSVRLLGGEPLLHPDILAMIAVARESGISDHVEVWTNGLLLWRMPDEFWKAVDGVTVSVYPGKEMTPRQVRTCHQKARRYGTMLNMAIADEFRESYSEVGTNDATLIRKLYRTCWLLKCHQIEKGFFFKCAPSVFLPRMLQTKFRSPRIDGIKIVDSPSFGEKLRAFLDSPYPLASCKHCLGSAGKKISHSQVRRSEWRQPQESKSEEMIDYELLSTMEKQPGGAWETYRRARPRARYQINSRRQLLAYIKRKYGVIELFKYMISACQRAPGSERAENFGHGHPIELGSSRQ
jgi:cyclic pyranopterin phosphate synthase